MKKLDFLRPVLILSGICLVVALLLAGTNELTKGTIKEQEEAASLAQKQMIFPAATLFTPVTLSEPQITTMVQKDITISEVSLAKDDNDTVLGYVFISRSRGYAGYVTATTGISPAGEIIMVSILAPDDTPGLGKRVEEDFFRLQFSNLTAQSLISVTGANDTQKIDSVSGATISSRGAAEAVNKAIGAYNFLKEEGAIT